MIMIMIVTGSGREKDGDNDCERGGTDSDGYDDWESQQMEGEERGTRASCSAVLCR